MMEKLLEAYEKGAITADHLVVECLNLVNPAEPAKVLEPLPHDVLVRLLRYANQYRPGRMRTNYGRQPGADQILAAKGWIEARGVCETLPDEWGRLSKYGHREAVTKEGQTGDQVKPGISALGHT